MIKLSHISKEFVSGKRTVHAVQDVSLTIDKGEIFGMIGFSGAGKSTFGALHQSARAADLRQGDRRWSGYAVALGKGAAAGPQEDWHDLSALQPDALAHRSRQRSVSAARQRPFQTADRGKSTAVA